MYNFPSDGMRRVVVENLVVGALVGPVAAEVAVLVPGVVPGDVGFFSRQQANTQAVSCDGARCAVAGTMLLRFVNASAGSITPTATDDYDLFIIRPTGEVTTV